MGKTNAEVSKWLSGLHNLTTASIGKMTAALGEPIIHSTDCAKKEFATVQYVTLKVHIPVDKVPENYPDRQASVSYKLSKYAK